ncbi:hypothetical protein [Leptospira mtsangambouensis]|uniref:hypothetical protein n=1 Tax=Leptospira mtsangambouensis TaxID=2484912 RepID=UPI001082F214|nr:hypothetical protein [Leptospira mtsangambouensis]
MKISNNSRLNIINIDGMIGEYKFVIDGDTFFESGPSFLKEENFSNIYKIEFHDRYFFLYDIVGGFYYIPVFKIKTDEVLLLSSILKQFTKIE